MTTPDPRREGLDEAEEALVRAVITRAGDEPGPLLEVLHGVQDALGCVPAAAIPVIADGLNLSRAEVHGAVSFYHHFRQAPPGRHVLRLCRAESCQAMGAAKLERHVKTTLGIDYHETSGDGALTLEPVYCLGACACSPALMLDGELHGRVTPARFDALLDGLRGRQ